MISLKLVLPRPARGWRKKTGPRDSSLIAIAIAIISGEKTTIRASEPTTSSTRLAAIEAEVRIGAPIESSGRPPTWSSARTPSRNSKRRGTTSTATPASRQARIDSSSCSWLAREKAMITRSMLLRLDDRVEVGEAAQPGQVGGADVVHFVVDDADRDEAELGVVAGAS